MKTETTIIHFQNHKTMKKYFLLILVLSVMINGIAQENESKVKLAVSTSNNFMVCFTNGYRNFDLTLFEVGVDIKTNRCNIKLFPTYGFNFYLENPPPYRNHLLGISSEIVILNETKRFRPFVGVSLLSEIRTNYKNGYVDMNYYFYTSTPISSADFIFVSKTMPHKIIYGGWFYQSMPLVGTISAGCNIRLVKGFSLNLAVGYNLSLMRYKYVKWEYDDYVKEDYRDKLGDAPINTKALHSMAFQLGLSYAFSFKKKEKVTSKN